MNPTTQSEFTDVLREIEQTMLEVRQLLVSLVELLGLTPDASEQAILASIRVLVADRAERDRLKALLNRPETMRFLEGTRLEVAHQVERWGTVHDRAKEPADWFWLVGYLAGKALRSHIDGDHDKARHHCISSAAVLANWHTHITLGSGEFTPGASDLQQHLERTFGAPLPEQAA